MKAALLFSFVATSEAIVKKDELPGLGRESLISIPFRSYKNDCGKKRPVSTSFLQNPGVGMDKDAVEPFITVEKDGFMMINCIKDALLLHGDKHGINKLDYKIGQTSNVSILHYNDFVPKEDRVSMTHAVCFEFCRTVPDMLFFGINNGRDCYCAPYFKPMGADMDGSDCDAVCEGDETLMCGGKVKSHIFEMHSCDHTESQLETATEDAGEAIQALQTAVDALKEAAENGEAAANTVQDVMGAAGDPEASTLCQKAKVNFGEMIHLAEDAESLLDTAAEKKQEGNDMKGKNFKTLENAKAAESAIAALNVAITQMTEMEEKVQTVFDETFPDETTLDETDLEQYVSLMTFADNHARGGIHTEAPATCSGEWIQGAYDMTMGMCASMCDDLITKGCTAFQYFGEGGLCIFLKTVRKAQYYTKCGVGEEEFLQTAEKKKTGAPPFEAHCFVKSSDFQNVGDLKNRLFSNTAHVNAFGLQELIKAERCY